jgi:peroxiredoxin Q/BCP
MTTSSRPSALGLKTPDFRAASTHASGEFIFADHTGTALVLYFYPKDNTPGCTTEAMQFRDLHGEFAKAGATILGVSRDSIKSHQGFKTKLGLPFDLLSDGDETLCRMFDVIRTKNMYGKQVQGIERSTFIIDASGIVRHEWRALKADGHAQTVLEAVSTL